MDGLGWQHLRLEMQPGHDAMPPYVPGDIPRGQILIRAACRGRLGPFKAEPSIGEIQARCFQLGVQSCQAGTQSAHVRLARGG